jgi:hypothetical protein
MGGIARKVITFLDGKYTDEGTEIASRELQQDAGGETVSLLSAAIAPARSFVAPTRKAPVSVRVQFDAKIAHVQAISRYLKRPGMSASDAGRHTFHYFIRNEVGED